MTMRNIKYKKNKKKKECEKMRDDFMTSKFTSFMNPNQKLGEYKNNKFHEFHGLKSS